MNEIKCKVCNEDILRLDGPGVMVVCKTALLYTDPEDRAIEAVCDDCKDKETFQAI